MVGAFREPSCGRRTQPIHSIPYSVAQPLERGSNNYYSIIQGDISMDNILAVPIYLKMTLTAREAAEYSNIGINKIDSMLRSPNCPFVLFVGTKKLVKRREFEEYISQKLVI